MGIFYNQEKKLVGFGSGQKNTKVKSGNVFTTVKVKDFNLEEVMAAEVDQGYINKSIGDKDRFYAYGHLLRSHSKFILF